MFKLCSFHWWLLMGWWRVLLSYNLSKNYRWLGGDFFFIILYILVYMYTLVTLADKLTMNRIYWLTGRPAYWWFMVFGTLSQVHTCTRVKTWMLDGWFFIFHPLIHGLEPTFQLISVSLYGSKERSWQTVATEWEVEAMPTFLFFKEGKVVDKLVGARKDELQKLI